MSQVVKNAQNCSLLSQRGDGAVRRHTERIELPLRGLGLGLRLGLGLELAVFHPLQSQHELRVRPANIAFSQRI